MRGGWVRARTTALLVLVVLTAGCAGGADASDAGATPATATTVATTTTELVRPITEPPPTTTTTIVDESTILLAWTSGGLPPGFAAAAGARPEVQRLAVVHGGQADLFVSWRSDGTQVHQAASGWAYPQDTIAVWPEAYAGFVNDPVDRASIEALTPGEALLTVSSAQLRGVDVGGTLELRGATVTIAGVVSDRAGAEAELIVHVDDAPRLGVDVERFVLMVVDPAARGTLDPALVDAGRGEIVNLRTLADTSRLRQGDSVVPLVYVKLAFGEFAYRDRSGRNVEIDPAWVDANIVTARVPILGTVRCNRAIVQPLTAALAQLEAEGLAHVIDPSTYAGCWNARRILPGQPLSKHSWGIALDVNVIGNPRGTFDTQDPRFTQLMRDQGFAWGGDWLYADPAHYELDP